MDVHTVMNDNFLDHLTSAAILIYGLNLLKQFGWYQRLVTVLPIDDAHVHRVVSVVGAFVAGVGIHIASTGNADTGWHLAIAIPPLTVLLHQCWDWLQQFALQQVGYDMLQGTLRPTSTIPASLFGVVPPK